MGLDCFVSVLTLLLALAGERRGGVSSCARGDVAGVGGTDSLTMMKGRPCSSFIIDAITHCCQYTHGGMRPGYRKVGVPFDKSKSVKGGK